MKRDYHRKRREREPFVRELFGLGFTEEEIARAIDWSDTTVSYDLQRLGGPVAFPNRPKMPDIFAAVLKRYAELVHKQDAEEHRSDETETRLCGILAARLRENEILAAISGIEESVALLMDPSYPPELENHAQLLYTIFGEPFFASLRKEARYPSVKQRWREFLTDMATGRQPVPRNHDELRRCLAQRAFHKSRPGIMPETRQGIMPIWDDRMRAYVDAALKQLHGREEDVLRRRFGLDCERQTFEQIGQVHCVTRERIRQIEARAFRRLRHPSLSKELALLIRPVGNAVGRELDRRDEAEHRRRLEAEEAEAVKRDYPPLEEVLFKSVEELELSVRSANCLMNYNVELIGQLVQKMETDLLKCRNFGRSSLAEIKRRLKDLHPSLTLYMYAEEHPAVAAFNLVMMTRKAGSSPST